MIEFSVGGVCVRLSLFSSLANTLFHLVCLRSKNATSRLKISFLWRTYGTLFYRIVILPTRCAYGTYKNPRFSVPYCLVELRVGKNHPRHQTRCA